MGEEWDVMVGREAPWDLEDCHVSPLAGDPMVTHP